MITVPEIKIIAPDPYYSVENRAILDLSYYLSFVNCPPTTMINYAYNEKENYVEAVIELNGLSIVITKFLDEPTGYSVISKNNEGILIKANYYTESLVKTVEQHLSQVYSKPYIMYE